TTCGAAGSMRWRSPGRSRGTIYSGACGPAGTFRSETSCGRSQGKRETQRPATRGVGLITALAERTLIIGGTFPEDSMPVTARLSRQFYETFGDDLANELVEWINPVHL